ncbi:MAG: hypothetical protein WCE94_08395 [Candidatus Methanoperedens sp.]
MRIINSAIQIGGKYMQTYTNKTFEQNIEAVKSVNIYVYDDKKGG